MSQATDMLSAYIAAEQAVLNGRSYTWGDRTLTRADLDQIQNGRREWQRIVDAEARTAAGRKGPALASFNGVIR